MPPPETDSQLAGEELEKRVRELEIPRHSKMDADEKREAVSRVEDGENPKDVSDDIVGDEDSGDSDGDGGGVNLSDRDRAGAQRSSEAVEELNDIDDPSGVATPTENAELEHTEGGTTTREDLTDQGVPMEQGHPSEPQGPEDAIGRGLKRGDYADRVEDKVHQSVRIDGGSGPGGPLVVNDDGGIDRAPHTAVVPQKPRTADVGDEKGLKGGVETDPAFLESVLPGRIGPAGREAGELDADEED